MDKVLRALPQWKLEFTQIYEPLFPHLGQQLDFLANAVEDFAEGAYKELPFYAVAQATFALVYTHKKVGIIPDAVLNLGARTIRAWCARCSSRTKKPLRSTRLPRTWTGPRSPASPDAFRLLRVVTASPRQVAPGSGTP